MLRRWRAADLEPFAALNADPEAMEHMISTLDHDASDALAYRIDLDFKEHGLGLWAVEIPGETPFAGFVGLSVPSFEARFTPAVEVGWRLARRFWGRGYATEAGAAALADGFDRVGLAEIVSFTWVGHTRSRAVMERLGMTRDPADDFDHPRLAEGHRLRRHVLYRLSRERWAGAADPPAHGLPRADPAVN